MTTITQQVVQNLRAHKAHVLNRDQWGSQHEDVYRWRRLNKPVDKMPSPVLMQHITVTLDHGPLTGDFIRDVQTVERIGYERFGSGMSYNWIVDMYTGMIAVGQPLDAAGTHTVNDKRVQGYPMPPYSMNYMARAVAVLGMPNTPLSRTARRSLVLLGLAMVQEGALTKKYLYLPHSKFASKDCPCDPTRDKMPGIRRAVNRRLLTDNIWTPGGKK